jgi:hypothetical protein
MQPIYIGIDNGVSGSIGIITTNGAIAKMFPMPTKSEQNYTKAKKNITRIDWRLLLKLLRNYSNPPIGRVFLERPMVNPGRFQATASALRAMEATLIVLDLLDLPLRYVDSREWQKIMLPSGVKGASELKKASCDIGCRLFPSLAHVIKKHKDADGLLMAEWARRVQR